MNEFNWIFQRYDVDGLRLVNFVQYRSEGGSFAAAGRASDQNKPGFFLCDFAENTWKEQCLQSRNTGLKAAKNDGKISALPENINPEARFVV